MNENIPMIKPFLRRIRQNRSRLIAGCLVTLFCGFLVATVTLQKCHVGVTVPTSPEEIVGEVITLRRLTEEYFIDYHKMFSSTVRKDLEFKEHAPLADTIAYLRYEKAREKRGEMLLYAIFDNKDKQLIGSTEIRELNTYDPGQIGIWVNEHYWGGGRALEALKLISKAYFDVHPEHDSYIAHVRLWNKRSYQLMKKFGFKDEGYYYENGEPSRHILRYTKKK